MRWIFQNSRGSGSDTGWKTFARHNVMRSDSGKKEDLEFGQTDFCLSRTTINDQQKQKPREIKNNFRKQSLNRTTMIQQVQKVAREVAGIRNEVRKVRQKVDRIVIPICSPVQCDQIFGRNSIEEVKPSQICQVHNKSFPPSQLHEHQQPTTEDEADSIRSQTSSTSQSKTGSLRSGSEDVELDVDSGLELGGATFSLERPFHQSKERDKILVEDRWKKLFDKFDPEGFGEIPWVDFFIVLNTREFQEEVPPGKRQILQDLGISYSQHSTAINVQLFVNIMSGKRSRSFKCAVHHRDREVLSENDFHIVTTKRKSRLTRMARLIADEFLTEERDRKYYADHYRCLPPPLFIILVTLIQLGIFISYAISSSDTFSSDLSSHSSPLLMNFPFVYRPDKRDEIWRFLVYMFVHTSWIHLLFNLLVQLLVGLPLEMVHGSFRTGAIYMAGVLAGSLATSVFDKDVYLVGASGGVYALLAAHLANVLLNYNNMDFGILRLLGVFLIASVDVGLAVYHRYSSGSFSGRDLLNSPVSVSYVAHLAGALAGLTIGIVVLKNFEQRLREQCMWWVALSLYGTCTLFAIIFNLLRPFEPMSTEFMQISEPFPHPTNW